MQEFRRFLRGPAGKILLALIIIPFIISGFYGYFTGGRGGDVVAEVEGVSVYRQTLNERVHQQRQRARQMLREQFPGVDESMVDSMVQPRQVLDGMINNLLLQQAARDANMHFSDVQAMQAVMDIPDFQQDGVFSEELFIRTVRGIGQSPQRFLRGISEDILVRQFNAGFQLTDFALPGELANLRRLSEQRRDIRYLHLRLADLEADEVIDDDDIQAYYLRNAEQFIRPEQLRIDWLALDPESFRDQVEVSADDVQREYEVRREVFESSAGGAEQRWLSHLLLDTRERSTEEARALASELRERILAGEDFADIVAEYSDDAATRTMGGELGSVGSGDLPRPMERALFALEDAGDISEPVETDAGVHLVRLDRLQRRAFPSFEEKREEIRAELIDARADNLLAEAVIELEELAFEHSDLSTPAEVLGLEVETTDWFALNDPVSVAQHASVRDALLSDAVRERGFNSDLLELSDGRYVVVRLRERRPPEPIAMEEVRDTIVDRIRRQRAQSRVAQLAEEARAAVADGASLEQLAERWELQVNRADSLERGASQPHQEVVTRAFALPRPQQAASAEDKTPEVFLLSGGDLVAMTLEGVADGRLDDLDQEQQREALNELANLQGDQSLRQVMAWLRDTGKIRTWPERIEQESEQL